MGASLDLDLAVVAQWSRGSSSFTNSGRRSMWLEAAGTWVAGDRWGCCHADTEKKGLQQMPEATVPLLYTHRGCLGA